MLQLHVCIPRSFLVINVCSQGKTLCSPCISFVGLKRLITVMRVLHVGCSIPARTYGRAEFSQKSKVCSQLAVWNLLWSQSLSCKNQ